MFTSYFRKNMHNPLAVSIARYPPKGYTGRIYLKLAPPFKLVQYFNKTKDSIGYTIVYSKILQTLDPFVVYTELGEDSIVLCYETSDKFCHRHLVADWLSKNLNIVIKELT